MRSLFLRLLGRSHEPVPSYSSRTEDRAPAPEWASEEAEIERRLKTLEVAYALRTISRERYEDQRRRIERRASGDPD